MKFLEFLEASERTPRQVEKDSCTHFRGTEHAFPITEFLEFGDSLRGTHIEGGNRAMLAGGEIGFDFEKKAMLITQCDGCGMLLQKYNKVGEEKAEVLEEMLRETFKEETIKEETAKEFEELKVEGADEKITYGDPLGTPQPYGPEPQPMMWPWELEECHHSKKIEEEANYLGWIKEYWLEEWGREETIARIKKGMITFDLAKGLEIEGNCVECDGLAPITDPCTEEEANVKLDKALDYLGRKKKEKEVEEITKENELKEERLDLFYRKEEEPNPIETSEEIVEKVVHPKHYQLEKLGLEVLDIMVATLTKEEMGGFYKGNAIKYILRAKKKNGMEDYKKAHYYLGELIKEEKDEAKN